MSSQGRKKRREIIWKKELNRQLECESTPAGIYFPYVYSKCLKLFSVS